MTDTEKTAIYTEYRKKVFGYLLNHINDADRADDLCSDVFLKVYERLDSFDASRSSLSTWIFTVTRNTLTDYYRTRRISEEIPETVEADSSVEDEVEAKEELETLADALESLDGVERDIIILHYYKGMNLTECSRRLGISYSYAKAVHNKALAKLKKFF